MHELPRLILFDRAHEFVRDGDGHVEIVPAALRMLGLDEFEQVRMVAVEHRHLRASSGACAFHGTARRVEHVHIAARTGGRRTGGVNARTFRTDRRKVVTDPAAAAHRFGRLQQRDVDARQALLVGTLNGVAYRLHETVNERRGDASARRAHDAASTECAMTQVFYKTGFDGFS
jgi:hypothetical protein